MFESYWHLHTVGYMPIIPMHVFTEIGPDNWNLWNPNPPAEEMVTSGPFNVSAYEAGELLEFTFNPNYFFGPNRSAGSESTPTTPTSNGTASVTSFSWPDPFGEMDLVGRIVTTGSLFVIAVVAVLWWKDTRV
jgi:ABC-type transport system substrate-binding protein